MEQTRRGLLRTLGAAAGTGAVLSATAGTAAADAEPSLAWEPADSSNYTSASRESDYDIRWFLVHVAEGTHDTTVSWFKDPAADASTHYVVENASNPKKTRMLDESDIGWHAGNWGYNAHSLGIEHGGYTDETTFVDDLYEASAEIAAWAAAEYNFPLEVKRYDVAPCDATNGTGGVIGHHQVPDPDNCDVGGGGSGHTDPGSTWNWGRYEGYLRRNHLGTYTDILTAADLVVHDSPGLYTTQIDTAPEGTSGNTIDGPVDKDGYRWYEVEYDDGTKTGWSASDWLLYSRFGLWDTVTTNSALTVHDAPGVSTPDIDTAPNGATGTITAGPTDTEGYRWFEVDWDGGTKTGWVAGYWLE
jgi:N-acetyl-anhydromuramyl-L-alanine amidase AmpD